MRRFFLGGKEWIYWESISHSHCGGHRNYTQGRETHNANDFLVHSNFVKATIPLCGQGGRAVGMAGLRGLAGWAVRRWSTKNEDTGRLMFLRFH